MFNYRPDTPWTYLSLEPVGDDSPGLRLAPDGSETDTQPGSFGFGSSAHSPALNGASADSTAYGLPYPPFQAAIDPTYNPFLLAAAPRHPFQEAFDQLARIYAGVDALKQQASGLGAVAVDNGPRWQGSRVPPQLSDPWGELASRVSDGRFTPLSNGNPSIQASPSRFTGEEDPPYPVANSLAPRNTLRGGPDSRLAPSPAAARWLNAKSGEVLSDVASDDGLRDGRQYAQYRPPLAMGGVKAGLDDEGRSVLIPDKPADGDQRDQLEKLRQRGYPKPPDDPTNGSAMVKEIREREQYGRYHGGYHRYEFTDHLCDVSDPGCKADAAYEALLRHAVPGGPASGASVEHGQESPVSLMGVPGGRIRTLVDRDSQSIINQTLPDHQFHNGFVQRQIVEKDGKIYVRTFGEGNNSTSDKAGWNRLLAEPAFEESTARIRAALRPAAPIGKQ